MTNTSMVHTICTKPCKVWAMVGSGHSLSPSRYKLIKRVGNERADGLSGIDIPNAVIKPCGLMKLILRFRVFTPSEDPPRSVAASSSNFRTAEELRVFSWNAGNGLVYNEWILWNDRCGYDFLFIQEPGCIFSNQWQTTNRTCIHIAHHRASQLLMIRRAAISSDRMAYNAIIPGRLVYLRLIFHCIHDIFNIYSYVWNTIRPKADLVHDRADL